MAPVCGLGPAETPAFALALGHGVVEQEERESRLAAGDLTLVDFSRRVRWTMSSSQMIAVIFPASCCPRLEAGVPPRGREVPGDRGATA